MNDNALKNGIIEMVIWLLVLFLIGVRLVAYFILHDEFKLIWLINYIGMAIAFSNLLINKCHQLRKESSHLHKKYKPFKGFTILSIIVVFLLSIPVYCLQLSVICNCVNDIITLLALFFSLSQSFWDNILEFIAKKLK